MAVNKNFVVKNGLEVSTDLILANADTNKVGIATTTPNYTLHVNGGIGATDSYVSGISTVVENFHVGTGGTIFSVDAITGTGSVGVGTASPAFLLDVRSPVSTGQTALYVHGDMRVTGDINLDDITLDDAEVQNLTVTDTLSVAGITTINGVKIGDPAGIVTATSPTGIVTYFGDGSNLTGAAPGLSAAIGISSGGTQVGSGITMVDFTTTNATITVAVPPATATGVATVNIQPSVSLGLVIALGG